MPVKDPSWMGRVRTVNGVFSTSLRVVLPVIERQRAKPVFAYFGKAEEEWRDLSSASTPFRPSDLLASRLALFSLFRSFLARLSSGVSSFRLLFDFDFFPLFLARSSRHFSSK